MNFELEFFIFFKWCCEVGFLEVVVRGKRIRKLDNGVDLRVVSLLVLGQGFRERFVVKME